MTPPVAGTDSPPSLPGIIFPPPLPESPPAFSSSPDLFLPPPLLPVFTPPDQQQPFSPELPFTFSPPTTEPVIGTPQLPIPEVPSFFPPPLPENPFETAPATPTVEEQPLPPPLPVIPPVEFTAPDPDSPPLN
ncbi:hypothetical protein C2S52_001206 [Perilla frutescens var. hirtella]|uniref:Uncharacterized protein n=1 Tax=Perilla frutescens var. hirtella TaxID=608512 RepID=A0AAD4JDN2_PERFH|nr:hypothetical protein C2S51_007280 [Perilla frutescens var. frutescens]KAH6800742.1 hypothetical protein C2S52_001206 [Perilla frutescens var. hirtella]KAH6831486.1 hypothetical protein C2S53_010416 [Perilla frutescens var. hirtella]